MTGKELLKTLWFVGVAAASVLIAGAAFWINLPPRVGGFELVGQPFFENFTGSESVASLEVYAVDDNGRLRQFSVKKVDGLWSIPSHHGYPAEAADRLARTSSSIIGVTREALAGRLATEHDRFGVLDPQAELVADLENIGKRLILRDGSGQVLADLIIGREVEANDEPTRRELDPLARQPVKSYYVRRADETQTYRVALQLDLSTRFTDWIDRRLLEVNSGEVSQLAINNYELRERLNPRRQVIEIAVLPGDVLSLTRDADTRQWTLDGLDDATESLDASRINQLLRTLTGLSIVGVRPKYQHQGEQFLTAELKPRVLPNVPTNSEEYLQVFDQLSRNLREKGFNLIPQNESFDEFLFVSEFGEFRFATEDGLAYHLYFGRSVTGEDEAIEIGTPAESESATPANETETPADGEQGTEGPEHPTEPSTPEVKNRFVMITVHLDESALGPAPEMPTPPEPPVKPEGYVPAEAPANPVDGQADTTKEGDGQSEGATGNESGDEDGGGHGGQAANQDDASQENETGSAEMQDAQDVQQDDAPPKPERDPRFVEYEQALAAHEQAKMAHEFAVMRHQSEVEEYERRLSSARRRVAELNDRFGAWYYVVSADNLASLRLPRSELVKPKEPTLDAPADGDTLPPRPNLNFPDPDEQGDQRTDEETSGQNSGGGSE